MSFKEYFRIWNQCSKEEQSMIESSLVLRKVEKYTVIHHGDLDCTGILVVKTGQLRSYSLSEEGREITLYRLFERDVCLFSASCMMKSIHFELTIEAEKDSEFWVIPYEVADYVMKKSATFANYINEIMASRFSEVMWLMEQIMWKSLDKRLAAFLVEESLLEETDTLKITHEKIAHHLGSQREVISRMLKYFQEEGLVHLSRGIIQLKNLQRLEELS